MASRGETASDRAFRMLLRALPFDFRGDFGGDMEEVFRAQREDAQSKWSLFSLWWETILGIFRTAPAEHLSILKLDAAHALRLMRRDLGYTALAVVVLALGVGANTALFSVVEAVLLRPLPFAHGGDLVMIRQYAPAAQIPEMSFSVPEIEDYRRRNTTLASVAEYHSMTFTLFTDSGAERVRTGVVSADFFDMFGVKPFLGRSFAEPDDRADAPAVLLMSYEFWRAHGADRNVVGHMVRMNDREHTVIGVLPAMPQYPNENDVFMPTASCPFRSWPAFKINRSGRMMQMFGLLKPGVTMDQNRADLAVIAGQLAREYPDVYPAAEGYAADSKMLKEVLTRKAKPTLWLLMGAASFVLLIACANVANLLLSRIARRGHEMVVRSAMGAARSRLLRQILTENLIVAALAAGAGLLMAWGSMQLLTEFASRLTPRAFEISLDRTALLYATGIAVLNCIIFSSAAALYGRRDLTNPLNSGGSYSTAGPKQARVRNVLVISQVAFSFILLTGAGLLTRTLINLNSVDPGFAAQNGIAVGVNLNWSRSNDSRREVAARILEKLSAQPNVVSVALASSFPLEPNMLAYGTWQSTYRADVSKSRAVAAIRTATGRYFQTIGEPILYGRGLADTDDEHSAKIAIVSQSLARRLWGGKEAIGRQLFLGVREDEPATVVGVAADVKELGLSRETPDEIYLPAAQHGMQFAAVLVRSTADPEATASFTRRVIQEVDPEIAINKVQTFEQARDDSMRLNTLTTHLLGLFAVIALAISLSGVSGVLALSVSRRMREIAIRVALGAKPWNVLALILGQGMSQVLIGLLIGCAGALWLTEALKDLLFEVTPRDPLTFGTVAVLLILAALIACFLPARRAMRIEPVAALRSE